MNTSNLKPFRLEEFKSNEETPVVHADGDRAWIVFPPNWKDLDCPVAAIYKSGQTGRYSKTGVPHTMNGEVRLFFAPRKKVVPLDLTDVDRMRWLKASETATDYRAVVRCSSHGVDFDGSNDAWSFGGLQSHGWLYAEKITGPWHRCEKEVEV